MSGAGVPDVPEMDASGLRLAIVALVVLSPVAADEMAANLVNTIWVLQVVLPWALVAWLLAPVPVQSPRPEGNGATGGGVLCRHPRTS